MKSVIKSAFLATVPVLSGYLVLGFGFGLVMKGAGLGVLSTLAMSALIYAGSMQFVAVGLFLAGASFLTVALTTFMVNARHLFYGISMLQKYDKTGLIKPYLIFSLTDETYSLVCMDNPEIEDGRKKEYYLSVSLLNHFYWVFGSVLGSVAGSLISFSTEGIDFALTALFLTVFIEQWLSSKNHIPSVIGVGVSILCLLIFGADSFLIPTMIIITLLLSICKGGRQNG